MNLIFVFFDVSSDSKTKYYQILKILNVFKQLVCCQKMTKLKKIDVHNIKTNKFTRQHVVNIYDVLHHYSFFVAITIKNFLERQIFKFVQFKKQAKMNINNDSNASFNDNQKINEISDDDRIFVTRSRRETIVKHNESINVQEFCQHCFDLILHLCCLLQKTQ